MTDNKERKLVNRPSGGFFYDLSNRAKLIGRLMLDGRVNPFIKLLPLGSLFYLIFPDIPGPVDDALVIWLGTYLFVELCPPHVVQEHLKTLEGVVPGTWADPNAPPAAPRNDDIVDGEFYEVKSKPKDR